jgi:fumarylacetoacetate (FAA) hydrolase family protein
VEGRSALLLGKAKDNNASASIGPFIRLFDGYFGMSDVKSAEVAMEVLGAGGYRLAGHSRMAEIARPPESIAAAAIGRHHQYPDGLALYLGTMFAPAEDRHAPGKGFTHEIGDIVSISSPKLGTLSNRVGLSTEVAPWTFGLADFMRNLAGRGLL